MGSRGAPNSASAVGFPPRFARRRPLSPGVRQLGNRMGMSSADWSPCTQLEVETLVSGAVVKFTDAESEKWRRYRITPQQVLIDRMGNKEKVFAVARAGQNVVFFDDVEEEFAVGRLNEDGQVEDVRLLGELAWAIAELKAS